MGTRIGLGLVVVLLLAADSPKKDEATKKDKEKIQGTWKVVSSESGAKRDKDAEGAIWTFKEDEVVTSEMTRKYKLDATKKPKSFESFGEVVNLAGIYSLEGDELTICLGPVEKPSSEFSGKSENHSLIVLKRQRQ